MRNNIEYGIQERVLVHSTIIPALLFDWLITLMITLTSFGNVILEKSVGSKSGVYVDFYQSEGWNAISNQDMSSKRLDDARAFAEMLYFWLMCNSESQNTPLSTSV